MSKAELTGHLEYKTVAMPQIVRGRRRRRQTRAEMIAETLSTVINRQAEAGWGYVRADSFQTYERKTWFHPREVVSYTVLVFSRPISDAEPAGTAAAVVDRTEATRLPVPAARPEIREEPAAVDPEPLAADAPFAEDEEAAPGEPEKELEEPAAATKSSELAVSAAVAALRQGGPLFKGSPEHGGARGLLPNLASSEAAQRLLKRAAESSVVRRNRR